MSTIRVGIVGVGNCASSLVQGVTYYRDAKATDTEKQPLRLTLFGTSPCRGGKKKRRVVRPPVY